MSAPERLEIGREVPSSAGKSRDRRRGSTWRLLGTQVLAEVRRFRRVPEYVIGVVAIPVILFAMFGLPGGHTRLPGGTAVGALTLVSFACFGVVNQALFSFGAELAGDRGKGWLRRLRATPMPMWVYFAGKLAMNLVFTAAILAGTVAVALVGGIRLDAARVLLVAVVLGFGCVTLSPMGAAIAYWVRPRAASTIANLVFLPLSFASGLLYPIGALPGPLQQLAPWLPTYHLGHLAWTAMAARPEDLGVFGGSGAEHAGSGAGALGIDGLGGTAHVLLDVAVLVGWALVCAAVTVAGYRRDLDRERD
ncbi:MAG TPA: ABC transporter permease [Segeticoccus sp.]|uniref:ABC transporter permease n=1 Tax=Segeticoccus sp. TaxID=2706531 RepID=UPI002D7EB46E|nr:ABC transporter permease [Segeticoccus sp.]HET8601841.1 ABC transporter permease [Segeticoccus sp.]